MENIDFHLKGVLYRFSLVGGHYYSCAQESLLNKTLLLGCRQQLYSFWQNEFNSVTWRSVSDVSSWSVESLFAEYAGKRLQQGENANHIVPTRSTKDTAGLAFFLLFFFHFFILQFKPDFRLFTLLVSTTCVIVSL